MHPYVSHLVSQEHAADLRREADHGRLAAQAAGGAGVAGGAGGAAAGPRSRRPTVIHPAALRNRAGWTLVHLGLRMVGGSADG